MPRSFYKRLQSEVFVPAALDAATIADLYQEGTIHASRPGMLSAEASADNVDVAACHQMNAHGPRIACIVSRSRAAKDEEVEAEEFSVKSVLPLQNNWSSRDSSALT